VDAFPDSSLRDYLKAGFVATEDGGYIWPPGEPQPEIPPQVPEPPDDDKPQDEAECSRCHGPGPLIAPLPGATDEGLCESCAGAAGEELYGGTCGNCGRPSAVTPCGVCEQNLFDTRSRTWAREEAATVPDAVASSERAVPGGDFILDAPAGVPAIWGDGTKVAWAQGEGAMLVGHQGLGKTTIGQQLVLSSLGLNGGSLLGMVVRQIEGRVLYLAMDRPSQAARSWRRMVTEADRDVLSQRLVVWKGPLPFNVLGGAGALADWAQEICPGACLIMTDSVKDLCPGLSKDDVGAALNLAWQEVVARGAELFLLHHQRKSQSGAERLNTLDDVYGSTWLTSGLGSVLVLEGNPGDERVTLHHLKQPAEPIGPLMLEHDHLQGATRLIEAGRTCLQVLLAAHGPLSASEAARELYGPGVAGDASVLKRVRRELGRLVEVEQAVKVGGTGRGGKRQPDRWEASPMAAWADGAGRETKII
jgi:hypothetical protein